MKVVPFVLAGILSISGCASQSPNYIVLDPQLSKINIQTSTSLPISVNTLDLRTANYIVKFDDGKDAARLVSPIKSPRVQIDELLRQGFTNAGYQIEPNSDLNIKIQLNTLLTKVANNTFSFDANTNIVINVLATNRTQTLNKTYHTQGKQQGPFSADFASLELQLNKLMTEITQTIVQDKELNHFLQQRRG